MNVTIGCSFWALDEDGGYWDWTYDAQIFDPNSTPIKHTNEWASQKTGYSSDISTQLADPAEGDYTCTIDWYADSLYLGPSTKVQTLSYLVPTGESNIWNNWNIVWPTLATWKPVL